MQYLLMFGNPVDGFTYVGPFKESADAHNWAENELDDALVTWWICQLHEPSEGT